MRRTDRVFLFSETDTFAYYKAWQMGISSPSSERILDESY